MWDKNIEATTFDEKAIALLERLAKKYKLVLLSTTDSHSFNEIEKKFSLCSYFDSCITSHGEGVCKPEEDFFQSAISSLDMRPDEIVMVGDSEFYDIEPAIKLGLNAILLDLDGESEYEPRISSLDELEDELEKLNNDI